MKQYLQGSLFRRPFRPVLKKGNSFGRCHPGIPGLHPGLWSIGPSGRRDRTFGPTGRRNPARGESLGPCPLMSRGSFFNRPSRPVSRKGRAFARSHPSAPGFHPGLSSIGPSGRRDRTFGPTGRRNPARGESLGARPLMREARCSSGPSGRFRGRVGRLQFLTQESQGFTLGSGLSALQADAIEPSAQRADGIQPRENPWGPAH